MAYSLRVCVKRAGSSIETLQRAVKGLSDVSDSKVETSWFWSAFALDMSKLQNLNNLNMFHSAHSPRITVWSDLLHQTWNEPSKCGSFMISFHLLVSEARLDEK
jgi:hypothetical protein